MTDTTAGLTCTTCGKVCRNKLGLAGHVRSHKKEEETMETVVLPEVPKTVKNEEVVELGFNFDRYRELPKPIVEYLEQTFGEWLKVFPIGQEWKEDYGGYGMFIIVPREFSTEWKDITTVVYDNVTRKAVGEKKETLPDVRWKPIKDIADVKRWLDLVKANVITNAYRKGIKLPNTNTGIDMTKATLEQYQTAIAGKNN